MTIAHIDKRDQNEVGRQRLITFDECLTPDKIENIRDRFSYFIPLRLNLLADAGRSKFLDLVTRAVPEERKACFENKIARKRESMAVEFI